MKTQNYFTICLLLLFFVAGSCSTNNTNQSSGEDVSTTDDVVEDEQAVSDNPAQEAQRNPVSWQYADVSDISGKTYVSLKEFNRFQSYEDQGGGIIGSHEGKEYGVNKLSKGNTLFVVLEEITTDDPYNPRYKALDAIEVKGIQGDLNFEFNSCRLNGTFDSNILVVYKYTDSEFLNTIYLAWKADFKSRKFVEISTDGIDCFNPGWGV
jgi:hypothetical protein